MKTKQLLTKVVSSAMVLALSAPVWATTDATGITGAMQSGMTQVKTDIMSSVAMAVPIAMTLMATFLGIKKSIGFFQKLVNRAG